MWHTWHEEHGEGMGFGIEHLHLKTHICFVALGTFLSIFVFHFCHLYNRGNGTFCIGWLKGSDQIGVLISWDVVHDQRTSTLLTLFQRQCVLFLPSFVALSWFLCHLIEIIFSSLFRFWFSLRQGAYNIKITKFRVRVFGSTNSFLHQSRRDGNTSPSSCDD